MKFSVNFQQLDPSLWLLHYPLKMLGADLRRNVTLVRLLSGKLVIHSTAPFTDEDVEVIRGLGEPGWILDGILRHDTFAQEGRDAFPGIPYLAPPGFSEVVGFETQPIIPAPPEWAGELHALELAGAPSARDTALYHEPSRTLILTELIFNFSDEEPFWTDLLLNLAVGRHHHPGMPRPVKMGVSDKEAFQGSLRELMAWDFERIIVGHGDPIEEDAKARLAKALEEAGFDWH